ncbi:MAG: signal recognition particle protein [Candidatus Sumerlaeota bacterium]|nr:signal recognition particle protein [Candidatus Sumerlaeota bacterium]
MFESLTERLEGVFKNLTGQGKITESNVKDAMRDVRIALLEADVNLKVVKEFTSHILQKTAGEEILTSVTPGQQMVKIVYDELVEILGGNNPPFALHPGSVNVILMLGLQGSGKTTFCGKLARRFSKEGWKPLLVACDIHRPAAIKQLHVVGEHAGAPVFSEGSAIPADEIALHGMTRAREQGCNLVIIDTAGRLHIDEVRMDELAAIKQRANPTFTFLVADAMTGQDAVVSASMFNTKVGIDGVCLTKMDGDARGGAALSIKSITGKPVKFVGTGEKLEDLQEFFPDRMASRILGMGDIVSLVEQAQEHFDEKEAMDLQKKMRSASFTLQDFLDQMQRVKKMGPLKNLLGLLPGMGTALKDVELPEGEMKRTEAIIQSMTPGERDNPDILTGSRRARIARGSGTTPQHVNALIGQFEQMRKMMKGVMKMQDRMQAAGAGGDGAGEAPRASITGSNLSASQRARRLQRKIYERKMKQKLLKKQRRKKK